MSAKPPQKKRRRISANSNGSRDAHLPHSSGAFVRATPTCFLFDVSRRIKSMTKGNKRPLCALARIPEAADPLKRAAGGRGRSGGRVPAPVSGEMKDTQPTDPSIYFFLSRVDDVSFAQFKRNPPPRRQHQNDFRRVHSFGRHVINSNNAFNFKKSYLGI